MISHRHFPTIIGAVIGATLVLVYLWARLAMADAGPPVSLDAGVVDRVVAADHAPRAIADVPLDPPPAVKPGPSALERTLDAAGPLGRLALGGLACFGVARLLAWQRAKRGWLRRGWVGNAAASTYAALVAFGGVLALGGSIQSGLLAVGGAAFAGMGLAKDPETARAPKDPGEEAPT